MRIFSSHGSHLLQYSAIPGVELIRLSFVPYPFSVLSALSFGASSINIIREESAVARASALILLSFIRDLNQRKWGS